MHGASSTKIKVLRLRLKDKHAKLLRDLAREVNFVWNYCNELQITMFNRERRFLSGYDFAKFTRGATKEGLHLHSQTVQAIAEEYATRRRQFGKVRLGGASPPAAVAASVGFRSRKLRFTSLMAK
jgi:putative transposase